MSVFRSDSSSTSILHVCEQRRLWRDCAGSPEPSLVAYVISTRISWAGSNVEQLVRLNFTGIWARAQQCSKMNLEPSNDSEQPGHPQSDQFLHCTLWVAKYPNLLQVDREDWSDWADAKADLRLHWAHRSFCLSCSGSFSMETMYEPHHRKTGLRGLWPGKMQTSLLSYRD